MPVWGVWVEDRLCFGTDRASRKARNLAATPAVVTHLESGDDVVIIEGVAAEITDDAMLTKIDRAYFSKYKIHLIGYPADVMICAIQPRVGFAWREKNFGRSATRWRFHRE